MSQMVQIVNSEGRSTFVAPAAVASVTEAGPSSQWHGIRAHVRLFDGRVIEASQSALEISKLIAEAGWASAST